MDLVPVVGQETVLEDVIHRVMTVPSAENEHRVLENNCGMSKSVEGLISFTFNLLPFVLLVFDATLVHVSKPFFAVITAINVKPSVPKNNCVVSSLAWTFTSLFVPNINPFLLVKVVVEQVFIKVAALLLVASEEEQLVLKADSFRT